MDVCEIPKVLVETYTNGSAKTTFVQKPNPIDLSWGGFAHKVPPGEVYRNSPNSKTARWTSAKDKR